jgi:hypothetical protein
MIGDGKDVLTGAIREPRPKRAKPGIKINNKETKEQRKGGLTAKYPNYANKAK